jgi:hypothetical protein
MSNEEKPLPPFGWQEVTMGALLVAILGMTCVLSLGVITMVARLALGRI